MTRYSAGDTRTNRERMLAGDLYIADDPDNEQRARRGAQLADAYHRASLADAYYRASLVDPMAAMPLLKALVGHLGEGAFIKPPLFVDYGEHISIGAHTFANYGLVALDVAPITIGQDCQIGPNVQLLTPTHPLEAQPRRDKLEAAKPITIGDNVWIGGGAIICPGVTIGADSVIGAGAVVTRDAPPGVVAVGNPARVIKEVPGAPSSPPSPSAGPTGTLAEPLVQE